jgi:hypothetical protein
MTKQKKKGAGGARKGSGRKKLAPGYESKYITLRVPTVAAEEIKNICKNFIKLNYGN